MMYKGGSAYHPAIYPLRALDPEQMDVQRRGPTLDVGASLFDRSSIVLAGVVESGNQSHGAG
jgi:hypothetical protein